MDRKWVVAVQKWPDGPVRGRLLLSLLYDAGNASVTLRVLQVRYAVPTSAPDKDKSE